MSKRVSNQKEKKKDTFANVNMGDIFTFDIDRINRIIYISNELNLNSLAFFKKATTILKRDNKKKSITIQISSEGGDIYASLAMYDFIKALPMKVTTVAAACCMSGAILPFLAGDIRLATENTFFMIHGVSSELNGNIKNMEVDLTHVRLAQKKYIKIISENTKISIKQLEKVIESDNYFDSEKAKKDGFVTDIIETF